MAAIIIPVAPKMLEWARNLRGFSIEDAADHLGMPIEDLKAYESEIDPKPVNKGVFQRFARKYRLPEATLTRPNPPPFPPRPKDHRTFDGRPAVLSFETLVTVSRVQEYLHNLADLISDLPELGLPEPPSYNLSDDPSAVAHQERSRIGVTIDEQLEWQDPSEAFRRWRGILESTGTPVFTGKFPVDDCRGFSLIEDSGLHAIVVNAREKAPGARVFSLLHEYGHILTRDPGVSDTNFAESNSAEAFCNRFAAEFLMPEEGLRRILFDWPSSPRDWSDQQLYQIATALSVTRQALALRLEQMGLAHVGFYRVYIERQPDWKMEVPKKESKGKQRGNYITQLVYELGYQYIVSVFNALDHRLISNVRASQLLKIKPASFNSVKERIKRQRTRYGIDR